MSKSSCCLSCDGLELVGAKGLGVAVGGTGGDEGKLLVVGACLAGVTSGASPAALPLPPLLPLSLPLRRGEKGRHEVSVRLRGDDVGCLSHLFPCHGAAAVAAV